MDLLKTYLNEPTIVNKFKIIDMLKKSCNHNTKLIQRLMIFNLLQKDPHLENWFLECIKNLILNPNYTCICPEEYEDIFDDDSVS